MSGGRSVSSDYASFANRGAESPVYFDIEKFCIFRDGKQYPLSKKAHALLCTLRDNPQRLMSQDDLLDAVWPKTYVQPEIVKTYIKELRLALGDDARTPKFIETRRGCGYRFVGNLPLSYAASDDGHFVGRAPEIAKLKAVLEASIRGERKFVFITGESGIGKSALLNEIEARFQSGDDIAIVRGNCQPSMPPQQTFYPFFEILTHVSDEPKDHQLHGDPAAVGAVKPCIFPPKESMNGSAGIRAAALAWGVYEWCEFFEKVSRNKPLLLVIEDLQWADQGTLALLGALARRKSPASLSVFTSCRTVDLVSDRNHACATMIDLLLHCGAIEIALPAFSPDELSSYVEGRVKGPVAADKTQAIGEQSGGNPFLVEAIVKNILHSAPSSSQDIIQTPVPDIGRRVEYMLELQLSQLGPKVRRVIEAASISGKVFCSWSVSQLLEWDMGYVDELCEKLVRSGQLLASFGHYELPDGSISPRFKFKHQIYHELLVRQQSRTRLASMQGRLGIKIEKFWGGDVKLVASDITHRFELARDWPRAISYAKIAAVEARGHANAADSIRMANKALKLAEYLPAEQREREVRMIGHEFGLN
jgi:DNA-binding winged helix-turn-helix (wHTH) protein